MGEEEQIQPSTILSTTRWVATARRLFCLDGTAEVSEPIKVKADLALKHLNQRFKVFLKKRIPRSKRTHWVMVISYKNLPVSAAIMALSGHLAKFLQGLNSEDCLLVNDDGCFVLCSKEPDREGAYLYFDLVRHVFIRSGKVVGRPFPKRDDEHLIEAKKKEPTSKFYRWYPSEESERAKNLGIKGNFETHLRQVIAVGWNNDCEDLKYLDKNWDDGGILILNDKDREFIKGSMKNLNLPESQAIVKFAHLLGYQVEHGYDLALPQDPRVNASGSVGHESILGVISWDD